MLYQFNLSFSLSLLFMGFLFANIFGIITSTKNIVFIFILCIELINYFVYTHLQFKARRNQRYSLLRRERKPKVFFSPKAATEVRNRFSLTKTFNPLFIFLQKTVLIQNPFPFLFFLPVSRTPLPLYPRGTGYRYFDRKGEIRVGSAPLQNTSTLSYVFGFATTILNFLKIGFEFGFFVDAFKLGS